MFYSEGGGIKTIKSKAGGNAGKMKRKTNRFLPRSYSSATNAWPSVAWVIYVHQGYIGAGLHDTTVFNLQNSALNLHIITISCILGSSMWFAWRARILCICLWLSLMLYNVRTIHVEIWSTLICMCSDVCNVYTMSICMYLRILSSCLNIHMFLGKI